MEDNASIKNDVELRPCGKNEPFMVNGVDESFRSPSIDFSEDIVRNKEQVGDTHAANEKSRDELA